MASRGAGPAADPDLVISHCHVLLDTRKADNDALEEHLFDLAQQRLTLFFGYLGTSNPRTQFLIFGAAARDTGARERLSRQRCRALPASQDSFT